MGVCSGPCTAMESSLYVMDAMRIKVFHHVLDESRTHPETKSAGPDDRPCTRGTVGLLQRLHVQPSVITHVGKEPNKLEETQMGLVHDPEEVYTEYREPRHDLEWEAVIALLKQMSRTQVMHETGLSRSQITAIRNSPVDCSSATTKPIRHSVATRESLREEAGFVLPHKAQRA